MKKIVLVLLLLIIVFIQVVEADSTTTTVPTTTPTPVPTSVPITTVTTVTTASTTAPTDTLVPAPVASFSMSPTSGQEPLVVQFTDKSTNNPTSWSWDFGDGTTSTLQNPQHTFSAGSYVVILTATNAAGSRRSDQTIGLVVPYMQESFTATPTSGPAPLVVQFTDTSTSNPTGWGWSFGDGTTANVKNPTHTYSISGVFTVTLNVQRGSGSAGSDFHNPATATITVLSPIAPGTTTSPTLSPNQTATTTTSATVAAQTTLSAATLTQAVTPTPSGYYTPRQTSTTIKAFTSIPTNTPTQKSPIGIEVSILAISAVILIARSQYRKP